MSRSLQAVSVETSGTAVCELLPPGRLRLSGHGEQRNVTWRHRRPIVLTPGRRTPWLLLGFLRQCPPGRHLTPDLFRLVITGLAGRTTTVRLPTGWPLECGHPEVVVQDP